MVQSIMGELALRLYESTYRDYAPEVSWVTNAAIGVQTLIEKIPEITTDDIKNASIRIFGKSSLDIIDVNSRCDIQLLNFLQYINRIPTINEIIQNTKNYLDHLNTARSKYGNDNDVLQQLQTKLDIVHRLHTALLNENPTTALEDFTEQFIANKKTLQESRNSDAWYSEIKALLAKIPGIGYFFKTTSKHILQQ